eukprot:gene21484-1208_t
MLLVILSCEPQLLPSREIAIHNAAEVACQHNLEHALAKDYEFLKVVGKGSFGRALLVRRTTPKNQDGVEMNERVVAKEILLDSMSAGEISEAKAEISVLERLDHPNIVKMHHYVEVP